jgi:hypothetical protein
MAFIGYKPRVITLSAIPPTHQGASPYFFEFDQRFPLILKTNREASGEVLKVYSVIRGNDKRVNPIAFDYSKDILFLDNSFCEDNNSSYLTILELLTADELAQVQNLGIQFKFNWGRIYIGRVLLAMPNLKKLYFSVYPGHSMKRKMVCWHICEDSDNHRQKWVRFIHEKLLDYQELHPDWSIPDVKWVRPDNIGISYEEEKACVCGGLRYGLVPNRKHTLP